MSIKYLSDINISVNNFEKDVKVLVEKIRPEWNLKKLKKKRFVEGISNVMFGVYCDAHFNMNTDMILVRIDGKSLLDRNLEIENMLALSKIDLAAKVLAKFGNGCSYEYIHGTVLNLEQMKTDFYILLIVKEFAKMHSANLELNRSKEPFVFSKMKEITYLLPSHLDDPVKNSKYLSNFPSKSTLFKEIACLEEHLTKPSYPVTFCHNDLLVNNIILNLRKDRVHFIDFEYSDYNYSAFDIGNHFNEYAGLENVDYSLYPDERFQKRWIKKYLEAKYDLCANPNEQNSVTDNLVHTWYVMINKFSLVSHLIWSIWSILQDENKGIEFDYISYAILRWNEYNKRKDEFLAL